MKPKIKSNYYVYDIREEDNRIEFQMGSSEKTRLEFEGDEVILDILGYCDGNKTIEEISEIISNNSHFESNVVRETIYELMENGILFDATKKDFDKKTRYSRQLSFLSVLGVDEYKMLDKIRKRTVMLIGRAGLVVGFLLI